MAEDRRTGDAIKLWRVAALRRLEAAALARDPTPALMERAGDAVARVAVTMSAARTGPMLVLAGPGNNGGDALVAARLLRERGIDVRVAVLDAPDRYRGDARAAWSAWSAAADSAPIDPGALIVGASLVIDGLFGIGFDRAPAGLARDWIERVNRADRPVLAIDVPSGVDGNTGHVEGCAIEADRTITFLADKPGLHTGAALDCVGDVVVETLGLERSDLDVGDRGGDIGSINRPGLFPGLLAPRRRDSHKGSNGSVIVIGGDHGMVGAALMAARMALHGGAGRVYVRLIAQDAPGHDLVQPELMIRDRIDDIAANAVAIGPGLGTGDGAMALLAHWLIAAPTLCVDADALNAIARRADLAALLVARTVPAVLTPHPLEAARLAGLDAKDIQRDRVTAAVSLATRLHSVVVLKGAGTVIAEPDGTWVINDTGNPALGTGGTGDVLCGLVASLLAQRLAPAEAARAAVWLHGTAADDLVAAGTGPVGLVATELIPAIRATINRTRGPT
jgi:hydroxyethylthiazole kinase-like uncharacterized protein yjeF